MGTIFNFGLDFINYPGMIVIPTRAVNKEVSAASALWPSPGENSLQPKKRALWESVSGCTHSPKPSHPLLSLAQPSPREAGPQKHRQGVPNYLMTD